MNNWTLFEISINVYQAFLLIYFINHVTKAAKHSLWIDSISITVITLFLSSYLFIKIPFIDTVVFVFPYLHSLVVSRERWYIKLLWSVILAAVTLETITIISNLFMNASGASWGIILAENQYRMSYVLICNLCLFLVLFLITKLCNKQKALTVSSFTVFFILNALHIFSIEVLFEISTKNEILNPSFTIVNICIFLASIVSLILYELMSNTTIRQQEAETKLSFLQQLQEHQTELRNMYSALLEYQHDLRHRYRLLEELIQKTKLEKEELHNYLKESETINTLGKLYLTGNTSIDALLLAKKATMDNERIQFEYVFYPINIDSLLLREMDFCILLSNVLDNAIEAVQRIPNTNQNRTICLKFARLQDNFIIICQNDYLPSSIHKKNNKYLSSKPNVFLHGYGLESIEKTCEMANGTCTLIQTDQKFTVRIILPIEVKAQQENLDTGDNK